MAGRTTAVADLQVGITLPTLGDLLELGLGTGGRSNAIGAAARHVEAHGFESVWVPDLIIGDGTEALEATSTVAVAAAATERALVGFGVLVLPLRPVAWTAAQIQTLQHLSGNRVLLGVGAGGFPGAPFWQAVGVRADEQFRRTDQALDLLPGLIAGEPTRVDAAGTVVRLAPAAPVPPILFGGNSDGAIRRVIRHGIGWFPSLSSPAAVRTGVEVLRASGVSVPDVTVGGHAMLGDEAAIRPARDSFVRGLVETHHKPPEEAEAIPVSGTPSQVADRLAAYAEAGAGRVVLALDGSDWMRQVELLATARSMLAS